MPHDSDDCADQIRAGGHRVTPQRMLILDAICEGEGHTTLGEIYARVRAVDPSVDRSTVYRTLDFFLELRLVVSAETADRGTVYEIAGKQPHHHLVCRKCGAEQPLDHETVELLIGLIDSRHGFEVQVDHLVLSGLCHACRSKA